MVDQHMQSLLDLPSPAVLTTYRKDGTAASSPVWFRAVDSSLEVVIADDDVKLRHLQRDSRCVLLVFEAHPPSAGFAWRQKRHCGGMASEKRVWLSLRAISEETKVDDLHRIVALGSFLSCRSITLGPGI